MVSTTKTWTGGSLGRHQGRYATASDWSGGTAPRAGDTAVIAGVRNAGIGHIGQVITFPIGGDYTSVYIDAKVSLATLQSHPGLIPTFVVTGQTLDFNGTAGAIQAWLQDTDVVNSTIDATGTTVLQTYLDDRIGGAVNVGVGSSTGLLEMVLSNGDLSGVGIAGHTATVQLGGRVTIHDGSELKIESLAQGGGLAEAVVNMGTLTVQAGGMLVIDDTDGNGATTYASNNTALDNAGTILIEGAAGTTTSADITVNTAGAGTIEVRGGTAARTATTLALNGSAMGQHLILDDGVITINDAQLTNGDPSQPGFNITGGSFTFGPHGGTLLLNQPPLTMLQFVDHDTKLQQRPDGQHPFTTPIFSFGAGDTIGLEHADVGGTYVTTWDQATHVLSIESPDAVAGYPPLVLGTYTLEGTYAASGFQLAGDRQTELLSLTYTGPHSG